MRKYGDERMMQSQSEVSSTGPAKELVTELGSPLKIVKQSQKDPLESVMSKIKRALFHPIEYYSMFAEH